MGTEEPRGPCLGLTSATSTPSVPDLVSEPDPWKIARRVWVIG